MAAATAIATGTAMQLHQRRCCTSQARRGKSGRVFLMGSALAAAATTGLLAPLPLSSLAPASWRQVEPSAAGAGAGAVSDASAAPATASAIASASTSSGPGVAAAFFLGPRREAFLPGSITALRRKATVDDAGVAGDFDKDDQAFVAALQAAGPALEELNRQVVEDGKVLPDFGERAAAALEAAAKVAGVGTPAGKAAEAAVDAALHGLFLRQVSRLSQQTFEELGASNKLGLEPFTYAWEVQLGFRQKAEGLIRPGSDWSYESEAEALVEHLNRDVTARSDLVQERVKGALAHRGGIDAIAQLQERMERLALKLQQRRSNGLPWTVSTSYRIPSTPFQFIGRYDRGRADLELRFSPEQGTSSSQGEDPGKLQIAGPAALGVSFDLPF